MCLGNIEVLDEVQSPYISVIITAYRRKQFLLGAVRSVLDQTLCRKNSEIIVIKDYTDREIDKISVQNNVRSILTGECSIGTMLLKAIRESKGEVLCFLDDDDLFHAEKLNIIYELFHNNTSVVYYWNPLTTNESLILGSLDHGSISLYGSIQEILNLGGNIRYNLSNISIRRKNLDTMAEKVLSRIESAQDLTLFFLSLWNPGVYAIDSRKLTFYRIHTSSAMHSTSNNDFVRQVNSLKKIEEVTSDGPVKKEISRVRIRLQLNSIIFGMHCKTSEIFGMLIEYARFGIKSRLDLLTIILLILETPNIEPINNLLKKAIIFSFRRHYYAL